MWDTKSIFQIRDRAPYFQYISLPKYPHLILLLCLGAQHWELLCSAIYIPGGSLYKWEKIPYTGTHVASKNRRQIVHSYYENIAEYKSGKVQNYALIVSECRFVPLKRLRTVRWQAHGDFIVCTGPSFTKSTALCHKKVKRISMRLSFPLIKSWHFLISFLLKSLYKEVQQDFLNFLRLLLDHEIFFIYELSWLGEHLFLSQRFSISVLNEASFIALKAQGQCAFVRACVSSCVS